MSKSTHQIAIKAVDQTGAAFKSIKSTAAATGASIRSMVGGALAAAGAYLGFRAIKGGVEELGRLSDIAQKTSTNVAELTQAATAFNILGIQNMGVEQFAKAMDYLQKSTGRTGMSGFLKTIEELGKIEDVSKRGQEAMKAFGRSGMEFMPLIAAAENGTAALQGVIAAMPGVPQAAADAGDDLNDANAIVVGEFHSLWLQGIGAVCKLFTDALPSSARQSAAVVAAYVEYWAKNSVTIVQSAWERIKGFGSAVGSAVGSYFGAFSANAKWHDWATLLVPGAAPIRTAVEKLTGKGGVFADAFDAVVDDWHQSMGEMDREFEDFEKVFDARAAHLADRLEKAVNLELNYRKAAIPTSGRTSPNGRDGAKRESGGVSSSQNIRNDLIMAGSNAATKLQILGPSLQSVQKKTNDLLEKVVANTERTAENTEAATEDSLIPIDY